MRGDWVFKVMALSIAFGVFAACCKTIVDTGLPVRYTKGLVPNDTTDCPGHYFRIKVPLSEGTVDQTTVWIAGENSKVPEFHDCQRFADQSRKNYGDVFAVFASFRLAGLQFKLDSLNPPPHSVSTTVPRVTFATVAAAEVYTTQGMYDKLGIKPGFGCLYLTNHNNWTKAYMLSTGWDEVRCEYVLNIGETLPAGVKELNVKRSVIGNLTHRDYPNVARWEIASDGSYMIGIMCGVAWCQVGGPPSDNVVQSGTYTSADAVNLVSGWYDEQRLAIANPTGAAGLVPSGPRGIARPVSGLGDMMAATTFENDWVQVGTIEIQDAEGSYFSKLGLKQGKNRVFLKGRIGEAAWQAKIVTQSGDITYKQVVRHGHEGEGIQVPGTLRWRWLPKDETIWARCLEGCCQVQDS